MYNRIILKILLETFEPPTLDTAFSFLDNIPSLMYGVGMFLALAMTLLGGYMWVFSAGDPQKIKQAQGVLTWAVIGIVFLTLVRVILMFIFTQLGLS